MNNILLSRGNKKIGKDTFIINMNSAHDCPSRHNHMCSVSNRCYAYRDEKLYPGCLPYRRKQEKIWDNTSINEIAEKIMLKIDRVKKGKINYIRFSEAGDFKKQSDIDKLSQIADQVCRNFPVLFYGYTSRMDLDYSKKSKNMLVAGSRFMIDNSFTAVPKDYPKSSHEVWCPGDCRDCNLCKISGKRNIIIKYH